MAGDSASGPAGALPERRRGRPAGEELRGAAVAAVVERGANAAAVARQLGLGENTVRDWVKRFRERGHVRRDPMGGSASRIEPERELILHILAARPAISTRSLRDALAAEGLSFSLTTVQRFLRRHGLQRERRLARLRRERKARR